MQMPAALHEQMKKIREARSLSECDNVKLSRIYREAVEQYVNAKPQQQLLKEFAGDGTTSKTGRASAERFAARV